MAARRVADLRGVLQAVLAWELKERGGEEVEAVCGLEVEAARRLVEDASRGTGDRIALGAEDAEREATGHAEGEREATGHVEGERKVVGDADGERKATGHAEGERKVVEDEEGATGNAEGERKASQSGEEAVVGGKVEEEEEEEEEESGGRVLWCGYPRGGMCTALATGLVAWVTKGSFPHAFAVMEGVEEVSTVMERVCARSDSVVEAVGSLEEWCGAEGRLAELDDKGGALRDASERVTSLFSALCGVQGVMAVVGMRRSVGSVNVLPPCRRSLMEAFNRLHKDNGRCILTVGARALSKHAHRSSEAWWGVMKGSEATKNALALAKVTQVLDETTWLNIHMLPHDVAVVEVRVAAGYGARWTADGTEFRGFLEPQMEGGHEKGWRH